MKEVFGFPEIGQFRSAIHNVTNRTRYRGRDEVTNEPIFDGDAVLPVINYRGTVKLHGCFSEDSLVTLANGEEVKISDVNIGDVVLTYDLEKNNFTTKEVIDVNNGFLDKEWVKLYFDNNTYIECTTDHMFYTKNRGWVKASDLKEDDVFLENISD